MAGLSQNELKTIRANPMRKELDTFRTTFKTNYLTSENANLTDIVDQLTSEASNTSERIILEYTRSLIDNRRERCHTWSYPSTSGSASCSNHSVANREWASQRWYCVLLCSPLRRPRKSETSRAASEACAHSDERHCSWGRRCGHMDSCVGPHHAHPTITSTSTYNPSAISPIICILVPADALVIQHGQLRKRIWAQKAGRQCAKRRTPPNPSNRHPWLHPRRFRAYPPTWRDSRDGVRSMSRGKYPALHHRQWLDRVASGCQGGPRPGVAARACGTFHGVGHRMWRASCCFPADLQRTKRLPWWIPSQTEDGRRCYGTSAGWPQEDP